MLRFRHLLRRPQLSFKISPPLHEHSNFVTIRRVKFQRPWVRNFLASALIYGAAFHIWSSFVLLQFDSTDSDTTKEPDLDSRTDPANGNDANNQHDAEELAEEDAVFIPLSLPFLQPGKFYAGTDPEWQVFRKMSKDTQKLRLLKDELATIVKNNASQSVRLSVMLGRPLKITGNWLRIHFPYRAPPQYCRIGLEIDDIAISLVSQPMDPDEGGRLHHAVQPLYVALAFKDAFLVLLRRQVSRMRNTGVDDGRKADNPLSRYALPTTDLGKLDSLNYLSELETQPSLSTKSQVDVPQDSESSRVPRSSIIPSLKRLLLPGLGPGSDLYAASLAFRWRLNQCWARESPVPPSGVFYVTGTIGLTGEKGVCRVNVRGEYDPVTSRWSRVTMQLNDIYPIRQIPIGGF